MQILVPEPPKLVKSGNPVRQTSPGLVIMETTAIGYYRCEGEDRLRVIWKPGVRREMAKTPRATDSTTPKKRTPKTKLEAEAGTKVAKGASKPAKNQEAVDAPNLEERIRVRAYELYLQRRGQGGSSEQDWLQAAAEMHSQAGV